jgi:hypothetical protein
MRERRVGHGFARLALGGGLEELAHDTERELLPASVAAVTAATMVVVVRVRIGQSPLCEM